MSRKFEWLAMVLKRAKELGLRDSDLRLCTALFLHIDLPKAPAPGTGYPGQETLCEFTGKSIRQVRRKLGRLEEAGVIRITVRGHHLGDRKFVNLYEIVFPGDRPHRDVRSSDPATGHIEMSGGESSPPDILGPHDRTSLDSRPDIPGSTTGHIEMSSEDGVLDDGVLERGGGGEPPPPVLPFQDPEEKEEAEERQRLALEVLLEHREHEGHLCAVAKDRYAGNGELESMLRSEPSPRTLAQAEKVLGKALSCLHHVFGPSS